MKQLILFFIEREQNNDLFYILLLKDGLVTVPKQWITNDKKYTFWPSNMTASQCINLVKFCEPVNEKWDKYKIEHIYGTSGNLNCTLIMKKL